MFSRKIDAVGIRLKPVPPIDETLRRKLAAMEDKEEEEAVNLCAFGASSSDGGEEEIFLDWMKEEEEASLPQSESFVSTEEVEVFFDCSKTTELMYAREWIKLNLEDVSDEGKTNDSTLPPLIDLFYDCLGTNEFATTENCSTLDDEMDVFVDCAERLDLFEPEVKRPEEKTITAALFSFESLLPVANSVRDASKILLCGLRAILFGIGYIGVVNLWSERVRELTKFDLRWPKTVRDLVLFVQRDLSSSLVKDSPYSRQKIQWRRFSAERRGDPGDVGGT